MGLFHLNEILLQLKRNYFFCPCLRVTFFLARTVNLNKQKVGKANNGLYNFNIVNSKWCLNNSDWKNNKGFAKEYESNTSESNFSGKYVTRLIHLQNLQEFRTIFPEEIGKKNVKRLPNVFFNKNETVYCLFFYCKWINSWDEKQVIFLCDGDIYCFCRWSVAPNPVFMLISNNSSSQNFVRFVLYFFI